MARIFTTKFEFENRVYDAIITIIPRNDDATFSIKILDFNLVDLLPGGEIRYQGLDGFKTLPLMSSSVGVSLMGSIHSAIESKLGESK